MKNLRKKMLWTLGFAYVIDRIFYPDKYKKKEPELTMELKYTPGPEREPIKFEIPKDILCPYCGHRFEEMLKRSKKCPVCKKHIYRIKDYERKVVRLITEEENDQEAEKAAEDHCEGTKEYGRSTLERYQNSGVKRVSISSAGDGSCPACRKQSGKVYLIEDALKEMPIPCKDCTFDFHGVHAKVGWCRCVYIPELD